MIAFLTSSPCVYNAPKAIINPENDFLDNLRSCLPPDPRCLFICSSPDSPYLTDKFGYEMAKAFEEAELAFSDFRVLDRRTQKDAQLLIWQSDLIILAGGHVPTQNAFFQEIGLREMLENYQGVVMGISAGSMNSADRVYAQPEMAGESGAEFPRFLPGLGLTQVNILPHYQQVKDNILDDLRLYEDITFADSMERVFYALVDGSYVYQDEDGATIFGESYCIHDGIMEWLTKQGECWEL